MTDIERKLLQCVKEYLPVARSKIASYNQSSHVTLAKYYGLKFYCEGSECLLLYDLKEERFTFVKYTLYVEGEQVSREMRINLQ